MRCMQHVLWRGALALGLLVSGGTGAMLMPQPEAPVCERETPGDTLIVEVDAAFAIAVYEAGKPQSTRRQAGRPTPG